MISIEELEGAARCSSYAEFTRQRLDFDENDKNNVNLAVRDLLARVVTFDSLEKANEVIETFFSKEYPLLLGVDDGTCSKQQADLECARIFRFVEWFYNQGFTVIKTKQYLTLDLKFLNESVGFKLDILAKRGGVFYAINVLNGSNKYSNRARREELKTGNALSLLSVLSASSLPNIVAMNCYLKSKDDKKGCFAEYENKEGKNVASLEYADVVEPLQQLERSYALTCRKVECEKCKYRTLCKMKSYKPVVSVKQQKSVGNGKVKVSLTTSQEKVVNHMDGPLCAIAVPGAGKTHSLIERLVHMCQNGVSPSSIVFVTFTKKAAAEIRERVEKKIKDGVIPGVYTFHSLAHKILSDRYPPGTYKLLTNTAKLLLIEKVVNMCEPINGLSYEYPDGDRGLYQTILTRFGAIDKLKGDISAYKDKNDTEGVVRCYKKYKELCEAGNYYTYDDLIPLAISILEQPGILEKYQKQWHYFMADEFQDVAPDEAKFLYMLAGKDSNIVVVGDDDQNIYEWRGGTSKFMLEFDQDFKNAKSVFMEENFRTTGKILSSANDLISVNDLRFAKSIVSTKSAGNAPFYYPNFNEKTLVELIKAQSERDLSDICIIGRNNKALEDVHAYLSEVGIPSRPPRNFLVDSIPFLFIYDVLKLYIYDKDVATIHIARISRAIGVYDEYVSSETTWFEFIKPYMQKAYEVIEETEDILSMARKLFDAYFGVVDDPALVQLLDTLDENGCTSLEEIEELFEQMIRFGDDTDVEYPPEPGVLNIMTAHKSKGKEFPFVIIYQMEDFDDSIAGINLLYVAMTRAEKVLVLSSNSLKKPELLPYITGIENAKERSN